jgi:hypothetical protein
MANVFATHSVGNSLVTYLRHAYPEPLRTDHPFDFRLISSGEMAETHEPRNTVSLFLFRVTQNEHLRTRHRPNDPSDFQAPLSVDLHFLLTVWADNALAEHTVLSWAMLQLHTHSVLDSSSLSTEAGWAPGDVIHIIPAELSNEELMRIWDLLLPKYRLSISYIARCVRIDRDRYTGSGPVVEKDFSYSSGVPSIG